MDKFDLPETLKAKLDQAQSPEDIIRFCAEEGIEITLEQLQSEEPTDVELSEEVLDNVAGGRSLAAYGVAVAVAAVKWYIKKNGVPYLKPRW